MAAGTSYRAADVCRLLSIRSHEGNTELNNTGCQTLRRRGRRQADWHHSHACEMNNDVKENSYFEETRYGKLSAD